MSVTLKPIDRQVFVITGASSGIGLATAAAAAAQQAKLVLAARSSDALEEIVRTLGGYGADATHVVTDVALRSQVDRVAEVAIERYGRIDTWINNAGVTIYGRLEEVGEEDSRRLFDTNFWGVVNGSMAIDPARVADAILDAATRPTQEVKVGMMAKVNTTLAKVAPGLGEWVARMQADRQQYDEPPRDPEGSLYKPGGNGRIHGSGPNLSRGRRSGEAA